MTYYERATDCMRITGAGRESIQEFIPVDLRDRIIAAIMAEVAKEREACAKLAERFPTDVHANMIGVRQQIANAIRNRDGWGDD